MTGFDFILSVLRTLLTFLLGNPWLSDESDTGFGPLLCCFDLQWNHLNSKVEFCEEY
jgi:hypothetical protein